MRRVCAVLGGYYGKNKGRFYDSRGYSHRKADKMTLIQGYFGIIELCHSDRYDLFLVDMEQRCLEEIGILLRYNHNHDPHTGRFTSGSGVDNGKKDVDKLTESSIINYAKATDVFEVSNNSENSNCELQNVVDLMEKSSVGRDALAKLSEKGVKPIFDYSEVRHTNRGMQQGNSIRLYARNIANERVAAQTVIHETTHLYYGIGQNQWAEAVCFAKEKMFLTGRPLTVAEKRYIIKLAKDNYPEFNWKKGGYINGKWI